MNWNFHKLDEDLYMALNQTHSLPLDRIMYAIPKLMFWVPLIILCVFMYIDYKRDKSKQHRTIKIIMLFSLVFFQLILCEYILPSIIEPMAVMTRPAFNPDIAGSVEFREFSFPSRVVIFSSQICTVAAIAAFLMIFSDTSRWLKAVLIVWILLLCYNRIYIGAQYPSTLLLSVSLGAVIGLLAYRYYYYLKNSFFAI